MEPEKGLQPHHPKTHIYTRTWQEFTDKAIDMLMENPIRGRISLKYTPKIDKFVVKATDDIAIFMHKCKGQEYQQVMKFAFLAGKVFTNEGHRKEEVQEKNETEKKPKKQKKKKK